VLYNGSSQTNESGQVRAGRKKRASSRRTRGMLLCCEMPLLYHLRALVERLLAMEGRNSKTNDSFHPFLVVLLNSIPPDGPQPTTGLSLERRLETLEDLNFDLRLSLLLLSSRTTSNALSLSETRTDGLRSGEVSSTQSKQGRSERGRHTSGENESRESARQMKSVRGDR
jgi:hypothetical protein